jgi:hypothetical protein
MTNTQRQRQNLIFISIDPWAQRWVDVFVKLAELFPKLAELFFMNWPDNKSGPGNSVGGSLWAVSTLLCYSSLLFGGILRGTRFGRTNISAAEVCFIEWLYGVLGCHGSKAYCQKISVNTSEYYGNTIFRFWLPWHIWPQLAINCPNKFSIKIVYIVFPDKTATRIWWHWQRLRTPAWTTAEHRLGPRTGACSSKWSAWCPWRKSI